ncbi:MAG TPA: HEAT repeat domain-containing protein [Gemmataceae bacterium]|nr:HEAT repeat domain-containing protein [Gemmataceae bacterium]
MKFWRLSLVLITAGALALPASAGILFGKKTKPNPAERVPELIVIVKTDKDESKRASAAEELRQYDPAANPDIVPVLIDVLMNDAKPGVRLEAAESLGKLRPISQEAGWALEQAKDKDSSMRVRAKARYELLGYYWAGYHSDPKMKETPMVAGPKEQLPAPMKGVAPPPSPNPVVTPKGTPEKVVVTPAPPAPQLKPVIVPAGRPPIGETPPPPLADPMTRPAPSPSLVPRPLPPGPAPQAAPSGLESSLPPVPPPAAPVKFVPSPLPPVPTPPADGGPSLSGPGQ